MITIYKYKNITNLDDKVIKLFKTCIKEKKLQMMISGGTTFRKILKRLAKSNLNTCKLFLSLSDERIVSPGSNLSNILWLQEKYLNKVKAKEGFKIYSLEDYKFSNRYIIKKANKEFNTKKMDVGFLGVGTDGHIASIFDESKSIINQKNFSIYKKSDEKFFRITHNLKSILKIPNLVIVFRGSKKSEMFYNSILAINNTSKKYKNIKTIKKLINLYDGNLIILTN